MIVTERDTLLARLEALEAQQAVMAGFVSMLLQMQTSSFPEEHRASLRATYDILFEQTIATLLANELGFSDAAVHAIEHLRTSMLKTTAL
jgi:hypothetical protein